MELARLAPPGVIRALLLWTAGGLALVAVERVARPVPPLAPLVVEVAAAATADEVELRVREAVLLDLAHRLGWSRTDPVVARILQEALSVAEPEASAEGRLDDALALGLDLTEPTVRARLLDRAERMLAAVDEVPDDAALEAWRAAHADRFRVPDRWRVQIAGVRPGDDVGVALAQARAGRIPPAGEPGAGGRRDELATDGQLAARYGASVAAALPTAPPGAWIATGRTLLRVDARVPGGPAPLSAVRGQVAADWRAERSRALAAARWAELRATRPVSVVRR